MKNFFCALGIFFSGVGLSQDIPLLTQKLTNSFLYNPSVAGNGLGSLTLSHRQYWAGIQDSPTTNFLSFHIPISYHKLGFGVNVFQDKIGPVENMFLSGAFAYHIRFTDNNSLSMGVSAEFNNLRLNNSRIDVIDLNDNLLARGGGKSALDFSYGMSYQSKYVNLGVSINRIKDFLQEIDSSGVGDFPSYYSAFLNFNIPVADERDVIEPVVIYRSLAPGSHQLEGGLFYTYNNLVTLGGGYRTGNIMNLTLAVRVLKNVLIGYSREMFSGEFQNSIGSTNEFTLRLDFRDHKFHSQQKNAKEINTQALALRRKTLVSYKSKSRGNALQRSQKYKKKIRRNYIKSPNYRMNASKKLMTRKVKENKSSKKRRKPAYNRRRR